MSRQKFDNELTCLYTQAKMQTAPRSAPRRQGCLSTDLREAIEMRKQMTELLRRGGFKLHKWLTNDPNVLD